jgi:hypothetical protein
MHQALPSPALVCAEKFPGKLLENNTIIAWFELQRQQDGRRGVYLRFGPVLKPPTLTLLRGLGGETLI